MSGLERLDAAAEAYVANERIARLAAAIPRLEAQADESDADGEAELALWLRIRAGLHRERIKELQGGKTEKSGC